MVGQQLPSACAFIDVKPKVWHPQNHSQRQKHCQGQPYEVQRPGDCLVFGQKFAILNANQSNNSPSDAKLSFIAKIHQDLGHCMESIPKSDMASFITRCFLRNKLQCKKRTNKKSLKIVFQVVRHKSNQGNVFKISGQGE